MFHFESSTYENYRSQFIQMLRQHEDFNKFLAETLLKSAEVCAQKLLQHYALNQYSYGIDLYDSNAYDLANPHAEIYNLLSRYFQAFSQDKDFKNFLDKVHASLQKFNKDWHEISLQWQKIRQEESLNRERWQYQRNIAENQFHLDNPPPRGQRSLLVR